MQDRREENEEHVPVQHEVIQNPVPQPPLDRPFFNADEDEQCPCNFMFRVF